jgi:hypothetical protein
MSLRVRFPLLACAVALLAAPAAFAQDALPDGPGKATLMGTCTACHDAGLISAQHRSPDEWNDILTRMAGFGAVFDDAKKAEILGYLNANLGKGDAAPAAAQAPAPPAAPAPPTPATTPSR